MPELPDLILIKEYFDEHCSGKIIKEIRILAPKILFDTTEEALNTSFKGKKLKKAQCHGKYLFIPTSASNGLSIHFGMTGSFEYLEKIDKNPPYTCTFFSLNKGFLIYADRRRLGRIGIVKDLPDLVKIHKQGTDAFEIKYDEFAKILEKKKGKIKAVLMDQSVVAGLGNVYTDEILFQSKIHPESSSANLKEVNIKTIYKNIVPVLKKALTLHGDRSKFPKSKFLISNRVDGADCPRKDGKIKMKEVGGRSTYFCEVCQSLL